MTDQTQEVQETTEARVPLHKRVTVTNDGEVVFTRDFEFSKNGNAMKAVRQAIRDLGDDVSIRNAQVSSEDREGPSGWTRYETIAFTGLVITERPKRTTSTGKSNARKNAEDTQATETDVEILGIALDANVPEEDAREALAGYTRHQLIHAYNHDKEDGDRLSHFSTKATTVNALLALATVEDDG